MPLLHDYSMDDSDFHRPNVTEDLEHKLGSINAGAETSTLLLTEGVISTLC